MEIQAVELSSIARMALILVHVLAVAAASAGITFGEYAIFARRQIDADLLHKAGQAVTAALLVLWLTGLAVIWMDTRFQSVVLAANPKLLAKLTVVTLLSINGVALHRIGFKRLCGVHNDSLRAAKLPTVMGAISAVTWLYAAFVGLAKPVAPLLGYPGFMGLYLVTLAIGIAVALLAIGPHLALRLKLAQQPDGLIVTRTIKIEDCEKVVVANAKLDRNGRWSLNQSTQHRAATSTAKALGQGEPRNGSMTQMKPSPGNPGRFNAQFLFQYKGLRLIHQPKITRTV